METIQNRVLANRTLLSSGDWKQTELPSQHPILNGLHAGAHCPFQSDRLTEKAKYLAMYPDGISAKCFSLVPELVKHDSDYDGHCGINDNASPKQED